MSLHVEVVFFSPMLFAQGLEREMCCCFSFIDAFLRQAVLSQARRKALEDRVRI
jgi:hypothetical protein